MQIHVLIPIPHPTYPGPDPPENIYHYTTGLKLRSIINSGCIKPMTAKIEPHEKPVVFTSQAPKATNRSEWFTNDQLHCQF